MATFCEIDIINSNQQQPFPISPHSFYSQCFEEGEAWINCQWNCISDIMGTWREYQMQLPLHCRVYSNNVAGASPNINVELVDHQNRTHCRRQLFLTVSHAPVSHNRVIQQRSAPGTPCKHRRGSRSCSRSPSRTNSNDSGGLQVFLAIKASTVQILLWLIYFIKDLFHKKNFMNFESISSTFSFLNSGICINFYSAFS